MRRARQHGFTLIEVVVASALLALALTLLLGSLSGAVRQVRQADDASRVALHAQSLLAQVGVGQPLVAGVEEGEWEQGRYRWRLELAPFVDPGRRPNAPVPVGPAKLMELSLDVQWDQDGRPRTLQWHSLRLAPADPAVARVGP